MNQTLSSISAGTPFGVIISLSAAALFLGIGLILAFRKKQKWAFRFYELTVVSGLISLVIKDCTERDPENILLYISGTIVALILLWIVYVSAKRTLQNQEARIA